MARICYVTGTWTKAGHNRSHSMRQTKRKNGFRPNLIIKKVKLADGSTMKVKVKAKIYKSARGFIA